MFYARSMFAAGVLFIGAANLPAHAAEGTFERTLNVGNAADLKVLSGSGRIHVTPGPDGRIHIVAHVRSSTGWTIFGGENESDRVREIVNNPPVQQTGSTVSVGETGEHSQWFNNITIDYEISAPRSVALDLHTGSGDVEVDHLGRFLKAASGSGSVRAHGIAGPAELRSGSGDIELQEEGPGDVHASTGSGSIRVSGLAGAFEARTGSGDIEANGRLTGAASVRSGSGSIRLHIGREARYNLDASTGSGSIRASGVSGQMSSERHHLSAQVNGGGPTLQATTGSGDIEIN